jgi:hypothetical protein
VQHLGRRLRVAELLPPTAARRHLAWFAEGRGRGRGRGRRRSGEAEGRVSAFRAGTELRKGTSEELAVLVLDFTNLMMMIPHTKHRSTKS